MVWTSLIGVKAAGDRLTKTAATGWGNAGAVSTQATSGDGYVEYTVPGRRGTRCRAEPRGHDGGYADIDYALYRTRDSSWSTRRGLSRGTFGPYTAGDALRVTSRAAW